VWFLLGKVLEDDSPSFGIGFSGGEDGFVHGSVCRPTAGFALLARASRDRKLVGACSGGAYSFSVAADWLGADRMVLDLPPRKARAGRRARLAFKYGTVEIFRPRHFSTAGLPKSMTLQLVEVEEINLRRE